MTFAVSKNMREVAGHLLKDESLTRRERVFVEGLLDGTWRLAPDGLYISSGNEKQSQPSATSSKIGLGSLRKYRRALSEMFERAKMSARTMDDAEVETPIKRKILDHFLAAMLGVLTGGLLIAAVAAVLR